MTLPGLVYILCFATCTACATLVTRAWVRTRTQLLMWTAVSLVFLALNNLLVIADLLLLPDLDLSIWRHFAALAAGATLVVGFIWEAE
jgi:hypothetical protein